VIVPEVSHALSAHAAKFFPPGYRFDPAKELTQCESLGGRIILRGDEDYPDLLAEVKKSPELLYVRGALEYRNAWPIAIVGSRKATPYGLRMARNIAREAAEAGLVVVSGLARGVDTAAHTAALDAGGVTWAVLGSGLGRVYPAENAGLVRRILENQGAVLTEIPVSGAPFYYNFPERNRIISGLSWATVVVEGTEHSGSLITARCAGEQGREVFAVPGPADAPMSQGPIKLLRDGVAPARFLKDVIDAMPTLRAYLDARRPVSEESTAADSEVSVKPALTLEEGKILQLMGSGTVHLETLLQSTGWGLTMLSRVLLDMELKELIDSHPGQQYAKR
jgi:DNA processing protein